MKFQDIQALCEEAKENVIDKRFFIAFYKYAVQAIEKIDSEQLKNVFKEAWTSGVVITHFAVYSGDKELLLALYGNDQKMFRHFEIHNFKTKGFSIEISFEKEKTEVCFEWGCNDFSEEKARKIFGSYILDIEKGRVLIKKEFFD